MASYEEIKVAQRTFRILVNEEEAFELYWAVKHRVQGSAGKAAKAAHDVLTVLDEITDRIDG